MKRRQSCKALRLLLAVLMLITMMPIDTEAAQDTIIADYNLPADYQQPTGIDMGYAATARVAVKGVGSTTYAASEWDIYGSDYFYNQMTTAQKNFYDGLYMASMKLLVGKSDAAEAVYSLQGGGTTTYYMTDYVTAGTLSSQQAQNVMVVFQVNNPQFYFVNEMFFYSYN